MQTRGKSESERPISDVALSQLYRGELGRSDRWRTRLDTTSNWALTTTAAVISFGFGSAGTSHVPILVGIWMVLTFLFIETRRYRYYDLWNRRLRLLEDGYWAPILRHEPVDPDALRELAIEMERPQLQLSFFSALQTRLNRAYGSLVVVLYLTWWVKVFSHPTRAGSIDEFILRAHVGPINGWLVTLLVTVSFAAMVALIILSYVARSPMGELRPRRRRRHALWESVYRPYAFRIPRRKEKAATQH
jgi:uncharacterized membrane protein